MPMVKLGEVAREYKETCKGDKGDLPIVGLEHLIPKDINLTCWSDDKENTFTKMFRKGHVLFGRRRAYLKKAAVAPFDGICSGDITVIEAIGDKLYPGLLPFIIQNDALFDFAVEKSAGSLSPRVKWQHLQDYEFFLPEMAKQKELAELLWAMDRTKQAYKQLISATDELVKSQFLGQFGDPLSNQRTWREKCIDDITENIIAGECLNGEARIKNDGEKAVLKVSAVTYGYFKDDEYKVLDANTKINKNIFPQAGDLLFSRANTREYVGATALIEKDYPDLLLPDKLWKIVPTDEVNVVFLKALFSMPMVRKVLSECATGTSGSMFNISMQKLKNLVIIVPPLDLQKQFAAFVQQTDKSKFELNQALEALNATYKKLISENLG